MSNTVIYALAISTISITSISILLGLYQALYIMVLKVFQNIANENSSSLTVGQSDNSQNRRTAAEISAKSNTQAHHIAARFSDTARIVLRHNRQASPDKSVQEVTYQNLHQFFDRYIFEEVIKYRIVNNVIIKPILQTHLTVFITIVIIFLTFVLTIVCVAVEGETANISWLLEGIGVAEQPFRLDRFLLYIIAIIGLFGIVKVAAATYSIRCLSNYFNAASFYDALQLATYAETTDEAASALDDDIRPSPQSENGPAAEA